MTRICSWTLLLVLGFLLSGQARGAEQGASGESSAHEILLPGSGPSGVFLDYIAADLKLNRV